MTDPAPLPLPDPPLSDGAVALRPWRDADLQALVAAGADPLVHRFRHSLPDDAPQARRWLKHAEDARLRGERLELVIAEAGDQLPAALGSVSVWGFHRRNRSAVVSYWLLEAGRGRGRAAGAVGLLTGWAFDTLGLERLTARVEAENAPSQRLVERCGFRYEGTLRGDAIDRTGGRVDIRVYGLLRSDRAAASGRPDQPSR